MRSNIQRQTILDVNDVLRTYNYREAGKRALSKHVDWFPVRASLSLAGIVADLMGDGNLQGAPEWRIYYTSKRTSELKRFEKEIFKLFGLRGDIRVCSTNKYGTQNIGFYNRVLSRTLNVVGVPAGQKVLNRFSVPTWILEDSLLFSVFINRLFSCEGSVSVKDKAIEIQMYKSIKIIDDGLAFFKDIKDNLEKHYGIKTTNPFLEKRVNKRKDGNFTKAIRLKIKNKESLIKFYKFIGFDDKLKQRKLKTIIDGFSPSLKNNHIRL